MFPGSAYFLDRGSFRSAVMDCKRRSWKISSCLKGNHCDNLGDRNSLAINNVCIRVSWRRSNLEEQFWTRPPTSITVFFLRWRWISFYAVQLFDHKKGDLKRHSIYLQLENTVRLLSWFEPLINIILLIVFCVW